MLTLALDEVDGSVNKNVRAFFVAVLVVVVFFPMIWVNIVSEQYLSDEKIEWNNAE